MRARQPAVGNRAARNRQPQSPQLENKVLLIGFPHYSCIKSGKPTRNALIILHSRGQYAPNNRRF
ncbi:hypothetical protein DW121_03955 [Bacteroides sp. AM10-21B]|nr:hypothetical protein DW121_03955 [Bacteroides sp. AM10-21B]